LHGINQVQMHDEIGLNFAMACARSCAKTPDIIMVGEIRDFETAEIAVKASLTGHMVLSTLHTNDAPGDHLAPAQHGRRAVLDHRPASTSCWPSAWRARSASTARRPVDIDKGRCSIWGMSRGAARREAADHEGPAARPATAAADKGRGALYEVIRFRDDLKERVLQGASSAELKQAAICRWQGHSCARAGFIRV
jgi:type IV pilus assembly protein PilB